MRTGGGELAAEKPESKIKELDPNEKGVKPEVLAKKTQLEETVGKKLKVTSGLRPDTANHGDGSAIDLGLGSNSLSESQRNQILTKAMSLGFTGLGAEYRAPKGPHIHLDTRHPTLTGWGSDYTAASLPTDSPFLLDLIRGKTSGAAAPAAASPSLVDFIKSFEQFSPMAHKDFKQISIGYGTKANSDDEGPITEAEADARLKKSLAGASGYVSNFQKKNPKYKWGQPQMDALSSFAYNGGNNWVDQVTEKGQRSNSEILKMMPEYNKAGGKVAGGLVRRRAAESALFSQQLAAAKGGVFQAKGANRSRSGTKSPFEILLKGGAVPVNIVGGMMNEMPTPSSSSTSAKLGTKVTRTIAGQLREAARDVVAQMQVEINTELDEAIVSRLAQLARGKQTANSINQRLLRTSMN